MSFEGFTSVSTENNLPVAGNLTGNPRIIRDTVANIKDAIDKWNKCHLEGIQINQDILELIPVRPEDIDKMDRLTWNLYQLVDNCSNLVKDIKLCCDRIKAVAELMDEEDILFNTLPMKLFIKHSQEIYEAYVNELKAKERALEKIGFSKNKSEGVLYACFWKYQTYIDTHVKFSLEVLVFETQL